jgi:membrane associated rhomboid family serine protease/sRNA-binding protein
LFGSMFLHAGWVHLLGNMLFLYIFGDNVEAHLGRPLYALVYLMTGALGTLCYALLRQHADVHVIGASGAIAGILGCYFVWFPHNRVRVFAFFLLFMDVIRVPARIVLGAFLLFDNLLPLLTGDASSNVAYGAHLGGFIAGASFALLYSGQRDALAHRELKIADWPALGAKKLRHCCRLLAPLWRFWRPARPEAHRPASLGGPAGEQQSPRPAHAARPTRPSRQPPEMPPLPKRSPLARAVAERRWQDGAVLEAAMLRVERAREADATLLALADGLTQTHQYGTALAVLQRCIAQNANHRLDADTLARAHLRAGLLQWRGHGRKTAATQHLLAVLDLDANPRVHTAARQALAELAAANVSAADAETSGFPFNKA